MVIFFLLIDIELVATQRQAVPWNNENQSKCKKMAPAKTYLDKVIEAIREDKDPKGLALYKEKDPLKKAWSYVGMLLKTNVDVPETHYLAYDVASKLKKPCLQLRALLQLKRLVPLTCGTIRRVQHFFDSKCNDQLKQQALIEQSLLLLADYDNSMDTYVNKYVESINKISMHYTLKQSCKRENIKTDGLDINGLKNALISAVKQ